MNIKFENDFQQKIMTQEFDLGTKISSQTDVDEWRSQWGTALKSWHSPYKTVIDCSHLTLSGAPEEVGAALKRMIRFFEGFFLKKTVGFGFDENKNHSLLPFQVFKNADEAFAEVGLRERRVTAPTDFRSTIQLQNDFQRHVVELSFSAPVMVNSKEQIAVLKSKLTNNLMQWHSKWSLLVDCANLEMTPACHEEFALLERFLKGFFMKQAIGYSPKSPKENYPFTVFRARHNAVARLEAEGTFSGDEADCKSRKATTTSS